MKDPFIQIIDNNSKASSDKSNSLVPYMLFMPSDTLTSTFVLSKSVSSWTGGRDGDPIDIRGIAVPFLNSLQCCIHDPKWKFLWMLLGQTIIIIVTKWPAIWVLKWLVHYCIVWVTSKLIHKTEEKCISLLEALTWNRF